MINLKCNTIKRLLRSVIMGIIIGCVLCLPTSFTYASLKPISPNVVVTVDKNGHMSSTGNMFDKSLWYPGKEEDGTIRINNAFNMFKVTDLDVKMQLLKWKPGYTYAVVEDSFLKNMKLSLKMNNSLFQNKFNINNQSLNKFLKRDGDNRYQGYHLNSDKQFYVDKGDFTDIDYSLVMDQASGNELQDLTANVGVEITVADH